MNRARKVVVGMMVGMMMSGITGMAFAQSPQEPLEEVITIETFFPAPWAEFDEMRLYPTTREAGYCDNDRIGYMYYDDNGTGATQDDDAVKVCKGTLLGWQELGAGKTYDAPEGLKLGNTDKAEAGKIRWSGTDFEGYDGTQWISLTSSEVAAPPLASADCDAAGGSWEGGQKLCYFSGLSCASGWIKKESYSSSKSNFCSGTVAAACDAGGATCSTSSHYRENTTVESCGYASIIRKCTGSNKAGCYSWVCSKNYATCTATQTEIGCVKQ